MSEAPIEIRPINRDSRPEAEAAAQADELD